MTRLRGILRRLFPEQREVILRTDGQVRYLRLGRGVQLTIFGLLAGAIAWSVYATDRFSSHEVIISERDARIEALRDANEAVRAELDGYRTLLDRRENALADAVRQSDSLHASNGELRAEIARLSDEIDERGRSQDALAMSHMLALEKGARLGEEVRRLKERRGALSEQLDAAEQQAAAVDAERERLGREVVSLRSRIADYEYEVAALASERGELAGALRTTRSELRAVTDDRERVLAEREELDGQVAALSERLEHLETAHYSVVARLGERARESTGPLRRALEIAGLDVDRLLDRLSSGGSGADGIGGPLIALSDEPGAILAQQIAAVETRIDTLQSMQTLMEHLPLTPPLDEFRITSGFGRRVDPFTNTLALHPGIDLASRDLAPVMVTAPGTVTFVGWRGGFGKMVEVDHGLGLRTRYAHMAKLFVKRGQKVEFREKVGLVGSTGRSTAPHLHYEILVDGGQQDPANFMKAGQYVFKN